MSTYDAADNSAKCYSLAVHELRLQGLREGKFKPLDLAEELIASGKAKDYRRIGPHTLYNGDCAAIMPLLGKVDACVTDPPYGIDYGNAGGFKASHGWGQWRQQVEWDRDRPEASIFAAILASSKHQIIWGGNYFTDHLPPSMQWIMWDKGQRDFSLADFEMAWSSQHKAARVIEYARGKAVKDGKEHPTQKPVEVMRFCIDLLPPNTRTILDPFMGSGTTLVAAQKLGKIGIGIERDEGYFAIACRRLEQAMAQPDLFIPTAPKQVQEVLF